MIYIVVTMLIGLGLVGIWIYQGEKEKRQN